MRLLALTAAILCCAVLWPRPSVAAPGGFDCEERLLYDRGLALVRALNPLIAANPTALPMELRERTYQVNTYLVGLWLSAYLSTNGALPMTCPPLGGAR